MKQEELEARRILNVFIEAQSWRDDKGRFYTAKHFALITVDEKMKESCYVDGKITIRGDRWSFLDRVKSELEKLKP